MNEVFVTYELAKKLKEKGFDEECFGWYYPSEVCGFDYKTTIVFNSSEYRGSNYKDMLVLHKDEKHIDAPTISQVLKWLREEKKIHLEIGLTYTGFHCTIYKNVVWDIIGGEDELTYKYHIDVYSYSKTAEQAAIAGIEYTLDNLI